jgi:hypothetical protein
MKTRNQLAAGLKPSACRAIGAKMTERKKRRNTMAAVRGDAL